MGRVVIPKEIRRTLRIREGDPLEIFTDAQGGVIFRKYSPVGELSAFAAEYAEVLHHTANLPTMICDRDHIVAVAGVSKKEYLERRISPSMEELIKTNKNYTAKQGDLKALIAVEGLDRPAVIACPVLSAGDIIGAVVFSIIGYFYVKNRGKG